MNLSWFMRKGQNALSILICVCTYIVVLCSHTGRCLVSSLEASETETYIAASLTLQYIICVILHPRKETNISTINYM